MFTIKNALRNISRSRGRSILIGIIITIIAISVCVGLCIRQSAEDARDSALADLEITAQISPDRGKAMSKAGSQDGSFDKDKMREMMSDELSLEELQKYAKASSVKSFYYSLTASMDASGDLEAYTTSDTTVSSQNSSQQSEGSAVQGGPGGSEGGFGMRGGQMSSGDFTVTGYSSDEAMTDFVDGTCTMAEGSMFTEGSEDMTCVISTELATYNDLKVGDKITLSNPNNSKDKYTLEIVGIYENENSSQQAMQGGPGRMEGDPANNILVSYGTLDKIVTQSEDKYSDSPITGRLNGTYVVGSVANYEKFKSQATELGLSDDYVVSSMDVENYERSAEPLENLADFAKYFLIVTLIVGAVILVVLNIFSTRERKYEIGVLTAIGMKKSKVTKLFVTEILAIALCAVLVGGTIGSVASVPVTKALLSSQITASQERQGDMRDSFGRDNNGMGPQAPPSGDFQNTDNDSDSDNAVSTTSDSTVKGMRGPGAMANQYIDQISSAVNIKILLELLAACVALAMAAGMVSVVAIMRYEPLQILSNRD